MNNCFSFAKNNRTITFLIFSSLAVVLLSGPVWAESTASQGQIIFDRYYTIELQQQRCGYARMAVRESADQITSMSYMRINLQQFGTDLLLVIKSFVRETPAGELISIDKISYSNGAEVTKRAVLEGQELVVTTTIYGRQETERFAVPAEGFTTNPGLERLLKPILNSPGQSIKVNLLSLDGKNPFSLCSMEIIGPETIQVYGQATKATKIKGILTVDGLDMPGTFWTDSEGELAARISFGGLSINSLAAEKAQAKNTVGSFDLTSLSLIEPKVALKNPVQAKRAVYRLKLKKSDQPMFDLPETDMQRIVGKGKDYVDVEVNREDTTKLEEVRAKEAPRELALYLEDSLYLDWKTPSVKAAAEQIKSASDKPWDIALALYKYVDATIYIKTFEVSFDPASNVLASHRGDCTEHAVLLGALARARGLPSRIVTGLVQVTGLAGHQTAFGYHAWTEVRINGRWIALDAALHQAPADVSHIALGVSALNGSDPAADTSAGLLQVIGKLEIEVLRQE